MTSPPTRNGRPLATDGRPAKVSPKTQTTSIVQGSIDGVPTVRASAYQPDGSRRLWALAYRCTCGNMHMGRARAFGALGGERRARCGRRVFVKVVRVYPREAGR